MEIQLLQTQNIVEDKPSPRSIRLLELHQSHVYEGLLEGLPTKEMNRRILEGIPERIRKKFPYIPVESYLVPPVETPMEYRSGKEYPFGEPARLPPILCVGRWDSFEFGNLDFDYSTLVIVWFQDHLALPIDAEIVSHIEKIDWQFLAHKGQL